MRTTIQTAMAAAFSHAGFQPPEARLNAKAIDALAKLGAPEQRQARIGVVRAALLGEMSFALLDKYDPAALDRAIDSLLRDAATTIAAQRPRSAGGGQIRDDAQKNDAPAGAPKPAAPAVGGSSECQPGFDTQLGHAPAAPNDAAAAERRAKLKAMADVEQARHKSKIATAVYLSALDKFAVDGIKLRDATTAQATAWAEQFERDADKSQRKARFLRMVVTNVPPGRPIGEFVTDDIADEYQRRAEAQP